MNFKNRTKKEKIEIVTVAVVIILFILIGSLANVVFPGSTFALIIENSIGKFFNLIRFFEDRYVTLLES